MSSTGKEHNNVQSHRLRGAVTNPAPEPAKPNWLQQGFVSVGGHAQVQPEGGHVCEFGVEVSGGPGVVTAMGAVVVTVPLPDPMGSATPLRVADTIGKQSLDGP